MMTGKKRTNQPICNFLLNILWRKGIRTAKKNGNKIIKLIMSSRSLHHRILYAHTKVTIYPTNPFYIRNIYAILCNNN